MRYERSKLNDKFSLSQMFILLFMFLASMNFINRYFYWVFIAFILFCCVFKKIRIDTSLMLLMVLGFSFLFFGKEDFSKITGLIKPFVFPVCYLMGKGIINKEKDVFSVDKNESQFTKIIYIFVVGTIIHILLNLSLGIGSENRNTIDFWAQGVISATGQTALFCLPIGIACAWFCGDVKWNKKLLAVGILLLILYYNLILAGRTALAMILFATLIALLFILKFGVGKKQAIKAVLFILFALCLLGVLYQYNIFGIKILFEKSNFYERFFGEWAIDFDEDSRIEMKLEHLRNMWGNFWGGSHSHAKFGYAHDLFLDTYDYAGIIAFISLTLYVALSVRRMIKCILNRQLNLQFRLMILCIYVVLYMEFCIEPILIGMRWLFGLFCFIDGMLDSYIKDFGTAKQKGIYVNANR